MAIHSPWRVKDGQKIYLVPAVCSVICDLVGKSRCIDTVDGGGGVMYTCRVYQVAFINDNTLVVLKCTRV